jgi:hypothetical protein
MERPRALDFYKDLKASKAELKKLIPFANSSKAKMDYEDFIKLIDKPRATYQTSQSQRANGYNYHGYNHGPGHHGYGNGQHNSFHNSNQRLDEHDRVFDHEKDDSSNFVPMSAPCDFMLKDSSMPINQK